MRLKTTDMPEPITHLLFYTFVFSSVLIYSLVPSFADLRRFEKKYINDFLVLAVGGLCSLLPDIDAVYRINVGAGKQGSSLKVDTASVYAESIPEFPTVALPVAAILGLAFVFMRKKE